MDAVDKLCPLCLMGGAEPGVPCSTCSATTEYVIERVVDEGLFGRTIEWAALDERGIDLDASARLRDGVVTFESARTGDPIRLAALGAILRLAAAELGATV